MIDPCAVAALAGFAVGWLVSDPLILTRTVQRLKVAALRLAWRRWIRWTAKAERSPVIEHDGNVRRPTPFETDIYRLGVVSGLDRARGLIEQVEVPDGLWYRRKAVALIEDLRREIEK